MNPVNKTQETVIACAHTVAKTLLKNEKYVKIVLFGSRVSGDYINTSDYDLGIDLGHMIDKKTLNFIKDAFEELNILQKVDVVDFQAASKQFLKIAKKHEETIFERQI